MAGNDKTARVLKQLRSRISEPEQRTPIATDMWLPNHSGDHSRGMVRDTPVEGVDIVNKTYADTKAASVHTHLLAAGATDVTATAAELNILDHATLTVTELNYVDGVTSAIQTQLDAKGVKADPLSQFAATTSAQLAGVISDETGSGQLVFATSPVFVTPTLGTASATEIRMGGFSYCRFGYIAAEASPFFGYNFMYDAVQARFEHDSDGTMFGVACTSGGVKVYASASAAAGTNAKEILRIDTAGKMWLYHPTSDVVFALDSTNGAGNELIRFNDGGTEEWHIVRVDSDNSLRITESGVADILIFSPGGKVDFAGTGAMVVPRLTTTQRDGLSAVNGMIIYNSTANQFQFYENGVWVAKTNL